MVTGLVMYSFMIVVTFFGIVAEKSNFCTCPGAFERIKSRSSLNPIESISSASSRTILSRLASKSFFLLIMSFVRPGVPITICGPLFKALIWVSMLAPP